MSRHHRTSEKDPALTVGYGWDAPLATFYAWVGPDEGDCDADELLMDLGNFPAQIPDAPQLALLLRISGHLVLTDGELEVLCEDQRREGVTQRAQPVQKVLDAMLDGLRDEVPSTPQT